jgi:hypothetical protein
MTVQLPRPSAEEMTPVMSFLDRFGFEDDDEQCGESARGQSGDRIFGCGRSGVGFPELFDLTVVLDRFDVPGRRILDLRGR